MENEPKWRRETDQLLPTAVCRRCKVSQLLSYCISNRVSVREEIHVWYVVDTYTIPGFQIVIENRNPALSWLTCHSENEERRPGRMPPPTRLLQWPWHGLKDYLKSIKVPITGNNLYQKVQKTTVNVKAKNVLSQFGFATTLRTVFTKMWNKQCVSNLYTFFGFLTWSCLTGGLELMDWRAVFHK